MAEIVSIGLHGSERNAAKSMDLQDVLYASRRRDNKDVGFFACAYLVAYGIDDLLLQMRV